MFVWLDGLMNFAANAGAGMACGQLFFVLGQSMNAPSGICQHFPIEGQGAARRGVGSDRL